MRGGRLFTREHRTRHIRSPGEPVENLLAECGAALESGLENRIGKLNLQLEGLSLPPLDGAQR